MVCKFIRFIIGGRLIILWLVFLDCNFAYSKETKQGTGLDEVGELCRRGLSYYQSGDYWRALEAFKQALKLSPENTQIKNAIANCYFQLGSQAYKKEEFNKAKEYFSEAIKYFPDFRAYQNLAIILIRLGDYKEAAKVAQKGLKLKEDSKGLLLILAECYKKESDHQKLLEVFERLYKYYPDDLEIALNLGGLYRINRKSSEAMKLYTKLKERYPQERRVYERIAEIHSSGFRFSKAREEYEALAKIYPKDISIKEKIAQFYRQEKKYAEARGVYEELLKTHPKEFSYYMEIAQIYEEEKDISSAINVYKKAEGLFPENIILYKELGRLYELQEAYLEAEAMYKKMAELNPKEPYPLVRLGILYEKRGDLDSATESFRQATELKSVDPFPYYRLGIIYRGEEDGFVYIKLAIEKALKMIEEIKGSLFTSIQSHGGQLGIWELAQLGKEGKKLDEPKEILQKSLEELRSLRGENFQELESDLKAFLDEYPNSKELLEEVGALYEKQGKQNEAIAIWERLLKLDVKSIRAHLGLARAYEELGRQQEVILAYKRVLELDTACREAYAALIRLYKGKGKLDLLKQEWEQKAKIRSNPVLLEYLSQLKEVL